MNAPTEQRASVWTPWGTSDYVIHYGNPQWFEEDCDAAHVIVAFPQFFTPAQVDRCNQARVVLQKAEVQS